MKRLLIVEDEKLIRQGINVMVKRSDVKIEEILECKNGEEAYKILNDVKVDVMITDVRMPKMDGIELVTEGVLTLSRALALMKYYVEGEINEVFFDELDKENGGSMIAKQIIEDCSILNLFVGKAVNEAHQNPGLPFNLSIRMNLVEQIKEAALKMGKEVHIKFY